MKIEYDSEIDEAVKSKLRLIENNKSVKVWKYLIMLFVSLFAFILLSLVIPEERIIKFFVGLASGIIAAISYLYSIEDFQTKHIKRKLIDQLGTDQPIPAEYELTDNYIIFRKHDAENKMCWQNVVEVNDRTDHIELILKELNVVTGIIQIPKRIFKNNEQLKE